MNTSRFKVTLLAGVLLIVIAALTVSVSANSGALAHGSKHGDGKVTAEQLAFRNDMRKLWEDHTTWTRLYIVSAVAGLADTDATATRLLQNQTDIGDAVKPYYGDDAGNQLTALLQDHILIAADIVAAAKAGDSVAYEEAVALWYGNADEIAAFLNSANPVHWPLAEMQAMMQVHLGLTLEEAGARLTGDWEADIAAYDQIHVQALEMADMLSTGIISQFPKAFK